MVEEAGFFKSDKQIFDIKLPQTSIELDPHCSKSETLILPLSLENNATTTGTAAIIEHFGKEFGVPCNHAKEYMPFDDKSKTFDIAAVRSHHEFLALLREHKREMAERKCSTNQMILRNLRSLLVGWIHTEMIGNLLQTIMDEPFFMQLSKMRMYH